MKTYTQTCLATLFCLASATVSLGQQPAKPLSVDPDLMLMRSLPAVYMVRFFGVGEVSIPSAVEIHVEALDREFEQAVAAGEIPANADRVEFKWQCLRREPNAYLTPSEKMLTYKRLLS